MKPIYRKTYLAPGRDRSGWSACIPTGIAGLLVGTVLACAPHGQQALPGTEQQAATADDTTPAIAHGRAAVPNADERAVCPDYEPHRRAFFGDLHVHTSFSFDAYTFETRNDPDRAYDFARGNSIAIAPLDQQGEGTVAIQLDRPLDFAAVTDHAELLGEVDLCITPGSESFDTIACQLYRSGPLGFLIGVPLSQPDPERNQSICGPDGSTCLAAAAGPWVRTQEAAAAANDECSFTSFVGYEYTGTPGGANLHRNVIFRNQQVPELPVSYMEEPSPEGLWERLDAVCTNAGTGCEVLAIPHNSNGSRGRMFDVEYGGATDPAEQAIIAARRARLEPIMEVYQHKGASECAFPAFTSDEECAFELADNPFEFGDDNADTGTQASSDFLRGALGLGLSEQLRLGVNPFRLGVIGSTDTHNASPGNVDEDDWVGHVGIQDSDVAASDITFSPGGLVGIWAEENTRDALFTAMQRRETFATSGPRIQVRFFAGWEYGDNLCAAPNMLAHAYENGVAMGGTLTTPSTSSNGPRFLIQAMQDQVPLQVAQVIKIWVDETGAVQEQIFDVSGDRDNGASVNTRTCERSGAGEAHLCSVWQDPTFDPAQPAVYYVRVLENPSCRWNAHACNALPIPQRPLQCFDKNITKTVKERAWTSPIWYEP